MSLPATIVDEQGSVLDETLKTLLSDQLFNEFDCVHWMSATDGSQFTLSTDGNEFTFAAIAFPVLIKYHLGKELDKLVASHQWLADMSIPSKRHKAARLFHLNSAQNLTILDFFVKLRFLKYWGSLLMRESPLIPMLYEMFKFAELSRQYHLATEPENNASPVAGTMEGDIMSQQQDESTDSGLEKKMENLNR